jgi:hypothetical protein
MTKPKNPVDELVEKAEKSNDFTEIEIEILKRMASAWQGLEAFGRVANVVRSMLTWVGWATATYFAWKAGAVEFIKGVMLK